LLIVIVRWTS